MKLLICLSLCVAAGTASRLSTFSHDIGDASSFDGDIWAVLVAGSNGWDNYRHQADICHAYQILKSHGVPDERIIVMMYDDIADSEWNPHRGTIINRPNGPDVYAGVPKDYVGLGVIPEMFLKVLEADAGLKEAGNKILGSNEKDHVFVYFADHGAQGFVAFPNDRLYATDLIATLDKLHAGNKYSRMVIYLEACEAGTMFNGLLEKDHRIYAVTATNTRESSWAYYCDTGYHTCLGDEFSIKWLEDSDRQGDLSKETLAQQFERVQKAVLRSPVSHYGDLSFNGTLVSEYQGQRATEPQATIEFPEREFTRVLSYNVPIHAMESKLRNAYSPLDQMKLDVMKKGRKFVDTVNEYLATELEDRHGLPYPLLGSMEKLVNHGCYRTLVEAYNAHCFNIAKHTYTLRSVFLFVNVCHHLQEQGVVDVTPVAETIVNFCKSNVADHPFLAVV